MLAEFEVLRFNQLGGSFEILREKIAVEEIINIYINGRFYTSLHHTPSQVRELVIGHLLTEGAIKRVEDILEIEFSGKNVYTKIAEREDSGVLEKPETIFPLEGDGNHLHVTRTREKTNLNKVKFSVETIFKSIESLDSMASIFRASEGTHAAALIDENGAVIAFAEDISRHNALDKVVGEAAIKGVDLSRTLLAFSGRLTSEIVVKAAKAGIPVIVSLSAPTSMGIKIAEEKSLTLVRFIKERSFKVYTSPNRIIGLTV